MFMRVLPRLQSRKVVWVRVFEALKDCNVEIEFIE
jgi:hypothetical protein